MKLFILFGRLIAIKIFFQIYFNSKLCTYTLLICFLFELLTIQFIFICYLEKIFFGLIKTNLCCDIRVSQLTNITNNVILIPTISTRIVKIISFLNRSLKDLKKYLEILIIIKYTINRPIQNPMIMPIELAFMIP